MFENVEQELVKDVFAEFGQVEEIDMVLKQDKHGKNYHSVYIHFNAKRMSHQGKKLFAQVTATESARVYYSANYYWNVLLNTSAKPAKVGGRKLCLQLELPTQDANITDEDISPLSKDSSKDTLEMLTVDECKQIQLEHSEEQQHLVDYLEDLVCTLEIDVDTMKADLLNKDSLLLEKDALLVEKDAFIALLQQQSQNQLNFIARLQQSMFPIAFPVAF
jgi:hypothetical protein